MKKILASPNAPAAIGPYSQGVECTGRLVFVSGQLGVDPKTGEFAGADIASQTKQSLENLKTILAEAGMTMDNVVKATCYLSDIANFGAMNEVYAQYFTADFPARAAFQVAALPKGGLVEIEVFAVEKSVLRSRSGRTGKKRVKALVTAAGRCYIYRVRKALTAAPHKTIW